MKVFNWFKKTFGFSKVESQIESPENPWSKLEKISTPEKWMEMYKDYQDLLTKEDVATWYQEQFDICCKERDFLRLTSKTSDLPMIFVSSPYTHADPEKMEENYRTVSFYSSKLCSEGVVAISPILYGHTAVKFHPMPTDWDFWKNFCLTILDKCVEIHVLKMPGWELSKGMKEEMEFARKRNIKITYIEEYE
jgi:hypothetical protein